MINVHLLPSHFTPDEVAGKVVVAIDVLRATTSMCTALAAGADRIMPVTTVEEARALAETTAPRPLLAGERQAIRIEGFDFGNSPSEFTADRVQARSIIFTTTNGTRAIRHCHQSAKLILACFGNLSAVCGQLHEWRQPVELVCAGTEGRVTRDDALVAGAIVARLRQTSNDWGAGDDLASLVASDWQRVAQLEQPQGLEEALRLSRGGQNVIRAGWESDLAICAKLDQWNVVPMLRPETGNIERMSSLG